MSRVPDVQSDAGGLERRLHEAERSLAETQRLAGLGSWSWDMTADTLSWSPQMYRLFRLSPQEFEPSFEGFLASLHPDDQHRLTQTVEEIVEGTVDDFTYDHRIVWPDGQVRWVRGRGQVVRDEQENPVRLFGTMQDITEIREAEEHLREQRDRLAVFAYVLEATDDAVILTSPDGTIERWNPGAERLYGYTSEEAVGQHVSFIVSPETLPLMPDIFAEVAQQGHARIDTVDVRKDGSRVLTSVTISQIRPAPGCPVTALVGIARDMTASRQAEEQLRWQRDKLALLATVMEATDDAVIVTSPDGTIQGWNPGAEALYGYTEQEAVGQHVSVVMSSEQTARLPDVLAEVAARGHARIDSLDMRKDGTQILTSVTVSEIRSKGGPVTALVGIARDVTEQRRREEREREQARQLARLAFHDPLTGLPNRALLRDRLTHATARRGQHRTDVLLLDLDDFKSVNDVSGHAAGDQLLVEVARRLLTCVRPEDTVARLGGDEFAILLEHVDTDADGDAVVERVQQALSEPVSIDNRLVVPGASIGIGRSDDGADGPDELMLRADVAMYAAKADGKGRIKTFSADMADAVRDRADLDAALAQAVGRGDIVLHYQPIIDLNAESVSRVEALVRWQRPQGLASPWEFLAAAESSGVIIQIGAEVLRQALSTLRGWLSDDSRRSVAVNVSAVQLTEVGFAEQVLQAVETTDTRAEQLVLEVTESLFLDPEPQLVEQLAVLRERGVRVSIDDFGTGYSSLGRLQTLPVDSIKIDKSFVNDLQTGQEDLPILTSMIVMAHNLGLDVTAEGVESAAQAQRLVALGCEYLQGYHFARPIPADHLAAATDAANAATRELGFSTLSGERGQLEMVLVEDDRVTRHLVSTTLAAQGWRVHEADTVAGGERLASAASRVDCILVDLTLPDGDGIDLVAALRTRPRLASTPIIVLTGTADRDTKARAFTAGADDYIVKPVAGPDLAARVSGVVRLAQRSQ